MEVSQLSIKSGSRVIWVVNGQAGFGGVTITLEDKGDALLTSSVVDQAA
jgi:hypothetical protein